MDYRGLRALSQEVYLELIQLQAEYNYAIAEADDEDAVVHKYWEGLQEILRAAHKNRVEGLRGGVGGES